MFGISTTGCDTSKRKYHVQNVALVDNKSDVKITLHYREACEDGCMNAFSTREISPGESVVINLAYSTHNAHTGAEATFHRAVKMNISAKSGEIIACEANPFPDMDYSDLEMMKEEEKATYTLLAADGVCPQNTVNVTLVE
jgi:hypothetical protein